MRFISEFLTGEFLVGGAFGLLGLAITAAFRRLVLDWGLIWGALALLALALATPRWTGNFAGLRNLLFVGMAIVAVVAVTVAIRRGTGVAQTPLPFLVSLLGIYATVPDTESVLVLLGVTASMAIAWRPLGWAQLRGSGAMVMAMITALAVVSGGRGRDGSVIGALAAMAVIGLLACQAWPLPNFVRLLVHLGLVGWWSRVAGRAESATLALVVGLGPIVPLIAVCWWMNRRKAAVTPLEALPE